MFLLNENLSDVLVLNIYISLNIMHFNVCLKPLPYNLTKCNY